MEGVARTLVFSRMSCQGLKAADRGGTSDPYILIKHGGMAEGQQKTSVKKKTLDPSWDGEEVAFVGEWADRARFYVEVYDWNRLSKDKMIGQYIFDLDHQQIVEQGFPSKGVPVTITGSLGDGKGTVTLTITPDWDKIEKSQLSWPTHTLNVVGSDITVSMRLPGGFVAARDCTDKVKKYVMELYKSPNGKFWYHHYECSLALSDKANDEKNLMEAFNQLKMIPKRITFSDDPFTFTEEEGETTLGGVRALWATTHYDYSQLPNTSPHRKPCCECKTTYVFGVHDKLVLLSVSSFDMPHSMETQMKSHHSKMNGLWKHVLGTVSINGI